MKFTWRINNFSRLRTKRLYSDIFVVGGCKWRILIFPKGNNVVYLSLYLDVADSARLPYGWSIQAQFGLTVVDQVHGRHSIRKETQHRFNARESDWGFTSFMPLTDLYDAAKGFLVNDTVVVEADVVVDESSSVGFPRVQPPPRTQDPKPHDNVSPPIPSQDLIPPSSENTVAAVQTGTQNIGEVKNKEAAHPIPSEDLSLNQPPPVKSENVTTCPQPEHLADKTSLQAIESSITPVTTTNEAIAVAPRAPDLEQLETQNQNNTPRPNIDAANPVRQTKDFENVQELSSTLPPKSFAHNFHDPFSEVSELMHLTPRLPPASFGKVLKLCHTLETLTTEGAKGISEFLQAWEEVCTLPYPPNEDSWLKTFSQINSRLSSLHILYSHTNNQLPELESHCASLKASLANAQKIQSEALALATEERRINDTLSGLREEVYRLQAQISELESQLEVIKAQIAPLAVSLKNILIEKSRFVRADAMVRHQKKISSSIERNLAEAFQEAIRCLRSYMENPNASPPAPLGFADDFIPDI